MEEELGEDEDNQFMGFTHRGKMLDDIDDFREEIPESSEDENADPKDRDAKKGVLNEEMVMAMNFGGGDNDNRNKSRKEVFEEIIAKSKAYKMVKTEVKMASEELHRGLDDQF